MNNSKPLYDLSLRAILVVFCPLYFAVQVFFNFGISGNPGARVNFFSKTGLSGLHQPVKPAGQPSHHQTCFRLNKHFEPESLPCYDVLIIERPVEYLKTPDGIPYCVYYPSSPFQKARFLRGPPLPNDFS